jgi:hypothetical protein
MVDSNWSFDLSEFISTFIDLTHLVSLTLEFELDCELDTRSIAMITSFLERAHNVRSLYIEHSIYSKHIITMNNICLIVPRNVKYLKVYVIHEDAARTALKRLDHLSSITFSFWIDYFSGEFFEWLSRKRSYSTQRKKNSLGIWLGNKKGKRSEI